MIFMYVSNHFVTTHIAFFLITFVLLLFFKIFFPSTLLKKRKMFQVKFTQHKNKTFFKNTTQ